MAEWSIGIDIGGTFTDLVALDYAGGKLHSLKMLTTYDDPSLAVMEGVRQLMATCGIAASEVGRVVHATTLFTNALISRAGARTGLLCNQGFMDAIEIGNERKYDLYDLAIDRPRHWCPGTCAAKFQAGSTRMATSSNRSIARRSSPWRAAWPTPVRPPSPSACCMPTHRRGTNNRSTPGSGKPCPMSAFTLSSEVAPVIREFERGSTTVANAYIKPLADRYLAALEDKLATLGLRSGVLMMLSNGGLGHLRQARRNPIELLESGPAGGAIAAAHYGVCDQQPDLLAFDMGGTTAKLTLVEGGAPSIAHSFEAARRKRFAEGSGLPIGITTVHLIEIGAGGAASRIRTNCNCSRSAP